MPMLEPSLIKITGFDESSNYLNNIITKVSAYVVIELSSIDHGGCIYLTNEEMNKFKSLGDRRKTSFLGGRIALKTLVKKLLNNSELDFCDINTISGSAKPEIVVNGKDLNYYFSLSHDERFAFAAAGAKPIGADVEVLSDRILKLKRKFINSEEQTLLRCPALGDVEFSMRVWSVKESSAKLLNADFIKICKAANVIIVGKDNSEMRVDEKMYIGYHDIIDKHLFTIVTAG